MKQDASKGFHRYQPDSDFIRLGHRTRLVQKMFELGKKLRQSPLTIHLAVKLLDRVFSLCGDITPTSHDLVANGCILLAAKFEELDMNIPMVIDFQIANKFKISYHQIKGVEQELLTLLDFDFMALTPLHFLKQLYASGLLLSTDAKATQRDISEKTLVKCKKYAFFLCDSI